MEITLGLDTRTDSTSVLFHSQNGFRTGQTFRHLTPRWDQLYLEMYMQVKRVVLKMRKDSCKLDLTGTGYCASFNFRRTARAVTQLYDEALQESGIRSTQFAILVGIRKNQPVSIGALAEVLIIDQTTLTRSLRLLQKEGLINISERSTMRQRFLTMAPKGLHTLARSLPLWRKAHKHFVATVGSGHWLDLRNELEKIAHAVIEIENPRHLSRVAGR
jgi:DNA-binding MarR family transcriptional regulator